MPVRLFTESTSDSEWKLRNFSSCLSSVMLLLLLVVHNITGLQDRGTGSADICLVSFPRPGLGVWAPPWARDPFCFGLGMSGHAALYRYMVQLSSSSLYPVCMSFQSTRPTNMCSQSNPGRPPITQAWVGDSKSKSTVPLTKCSSYRATDSDVCGSCTSTQKKLVFPLHLLVHVGCATKEHTVIEIVFPLSYNTHSCCHFAPAPPGYIISSV